MGTALTQTDFGYTGQRDFLKVGTNAKMGLMDYNARFYNPTLGRYTQPDTMGVSFENPQSWNRYTYVKNNPVKYNDPTGHRECTSLDCDGSDDVWPSTFVNIWDPDNTKISPQGEALLRDLEGYSNYPYNDDPDNPENGNCTVGHGHVLGYKRDCTAEEYGTYYSNDDLEDIFQTDLGDAERLVRKSFQNLDNTYRPDLGNGNPVPILQVQFDALTIFAFNAGTTVEDLVNDTARPIENSEDGWWDFELFAGLMGGNLAESASGVDLSNRRQVEVNLFVNGFYP